MSLNLSIISSFVPCGFKKFIKIFLKKDNTCRAQTFVIVLYCWMLVVPCFTSVWAAPKQIPINLVNMNESASLC